jgi:hypothetical protein
VALIRWCARHSSLWLADSEPAGVPARARVPIVAGRSIGGRRVRALARRCVARASGVALIERRAGDRRAGQALPTLTGISERAGVAIRAGGAVLERRI